MELNLVLEAVKFTILSYGPLRPKAWASIAANLKFVVLKPNESFDRENGGIAYVIEGLLKEYDAKARKNPAIINFISSKNFIINTEYNKSRYLKAVVNTTIAYLDFEQSLSLFFQFIELKHIYDVALANYEQGLNFRHILLEEHLTTKRLQLFIHHYRLILSCLRKKDIANYCSVPYDNFVRLYNNLL